MAEFHIASLVVHCRTAALGPVGAAVAAMPGTEVHAARTGRLIVTVETASADEIAARLGQISLLDGVLSAALVYHQIEPEC